MVVVWFLMGLQWLLKMVVVVVVLMVLVLGFCVCVCVVATAVIVVVAGCGWPVVLSFSGGFFIYYFNELFILF